MDGKVGLVIRAVMREAKERAGSAERLVRKMHPDLRRSDSAISAYIKGDSVPPADVFLEAARVMEIRVDEHLYGESLAGQLEVMKAELEDLKRWRDAGGAPKRP